MAGFVALVVKNEIVGRNAAINAEGGFVADGGADGLFGNVEVFVLLHEILRVGRRGEYK